MNTGSICCQAVLSSNIMDYNGRWAREEGVGGAFFYNCSEAVAFGSLCMTVGYLAIGCFSFIPLTSSVTIPFIAKGCVYFARHLRQGVSQAEMIDNNLGEALAIANHVMSVAILVLSVRLSPNPFLLGVSALLVAANIIHHIRQRQNLYLANVYPDPNNDS